jgi:hypothetical protein
MAGWQQDSARLGELCICTHRLLRCITKRLVLTDARRIAHDTRQTRRDKRSIELWTAALSY